MRGKTGLKGKAKTRLVLEVEARIGEPIEVYIAREHLKNGRNLNELGKELGLGAGTFYYWANNGIPTRFESALPSKEALEELYHVQGLNATQIGEIFNLTGSAVTKQLKRHGIKTKSASEIVLEGKKKPTEEELRRLYEELGNTVKIAKGLGVGDSTVREWMDEYRIERKKLERKFLRGEGNDPEVWLEFINYILEKYPEYNGLPSAGIMRKLGFSHLVNAISRNARSYEKFRRLVNEELGFEQTEVRGDTKLESLLTTYTGAGV